MKSIISILLLCSIAQAQLVNEVRERLPLLERQAEIIEKMLQKPGHLENIISDIENARELKTAEDTYLYKVMRKLSVPFESSFIYLGELDPKGCYNPLSLGFSAEYLFTNGQPPEKFFSEPVPPEWAGELKEVLERLTTLQLKIQIAARNNLQGKVDCRNTVISSVIGNQHDKSCTSLKEFSRASSMQSLFLYDFLCEGINNLSYRPLNFWYVKLFPGEIKQLGQDYNDALNYVQNTFPSRTSAPVNDIKDRLSEINSHINAGEYKTALEKVDRLIDDRETSENYLTWAKNRRKRINALWAFEVRNTETGQLAARACSQFMQSEPYCNCFVRAAHEMKADNSLLMALGEKDSDWSPEEEALLSALSEECSNPD